MHRTRLSWVVARCRSAEGCRCPGPGQWVSIGGLPRSGWRRVGEPGLDLGKSCADAVGMLGLACW